jgi:hypothetical protein
MLDAGRELALEVGAALTIEHLRLEEVIQRARVPRSSVYRMWPYREEYIDDLLCYLAGAGSYFSDRPVLDPETLTVATQVVGENLGLLATSAGRRALLCEVVRITCARNYELTGSPQWRLYMALVATLGSTRSGPARRRIAAALEDSQTRSRESIVAVLRHLSAVIGLRLRNPAYTLDHVQLSGGLLIQALALRNVQVQAAVADPGAAGTDRAGPVETGPVETGPVETGPVETGPVETGPVETGPVEPHPDKAGAGTSAAGADGDPIADAAFVNGLLNEPIPGPGLSGEPAQWTLAALAFLGVVDTFMELDPDFVPPPAP